jgi:site-specific recombinase XerC
MPKKSKYPKLRKSVKTGKSGQVWVSWWYDMRGTGKPDVPLGTDHTEALRRWAELHLDAPRQAGTLEEAFRGWEQRGITVRPDGRERAPETIHGYRKCLAEIRPAFGPARWEDITLPVLRAYITKRSAKTRARQEMQVLSVVWGWARLEGLTTLPWPATGMQRTGWKGAAGKRQVEVHDAAFAALYTHADQTVRDALDIATATGLRMTDVVGLRLSDVRDGRLVVQAGKTGKRAEFDLAASAVLSPIINRRKANRRPEHLFLLAAGRRPVTYRALSERFRRARAAAAKECPEAASIWLRDMRKRAGQLAGSLQEASALLQHSSLSVTREHYVQGEKLKPVR